MARYTKPTVKWSVPKQERAKVELNNLPRMLVEPGTATDNWPIHSLLAVVHTLMHAGNYQEGYMHVSAYKQGRIIAHPGDVAVYLGIVHVSEKHTSKHVSVLRRIFLIGMTLCVSQSPAEDFSLLQ